MGLAPELIHSVTEEERHHLRDVVAHLAHFLPAQGPIGVFIHHNTLHAFQHLPFETAVIQAAELYGTEPYMQEEAYLAEIAKQRIRPEDIEAILSSEPNSEILPGRLDRRALRSTMLVPGVRSFHGETIEWHLGEGGLLKSFRPGLSAGARAALGPDTPEAVRALFWVGASRIPPRGTPQEVAPMRPRDGVLARYGTDLDDIVHPVLIRYSGAFLDQGLAYWAMPNRDRGFLQASRDVILQSGCVLPEHLGSLPALLRAQDSAAMNAEMVVRHALQVLGVKESEWETAIKAELLALPGWAGMMHRLEQEPELAPHDRVPASLLEFLAVRLTLTLAAMDAFPGSLECWREPIWQAPPPETAFLVDAACLFDVAQLVGLSTEVLTRMPAEQFTRLWSEITSFGELERRRVLHLAYERRHERSILLPLLQHRRHQPMQTPPRLAAQVFFCIDEREESIRRHLEEVDREIETFSAAGFFGVAVDYTGIDDAHGAALCPVVVKPQHAVEERPIPDDRHLYEKRKARRRMWAQAARNGFVSSRTLFRGWLSTIVLGTLSIFPLAVHVLAPRRYAKFMKWLNDSFLPEPRTELTYMRPDAVGHAAADGLLLGFSVQEKIDRVASVLGPAGMRKEMARIVIVLGHGSTSLNNPHESAHDCGACGGRRGGPNARLFAAMANHPEVRKGLRLVGIHIPEDTWFVGGYHDTCNDDVDLFDLNLVPASHGSDLIRARTSLDRARALSAHERARRFEAAGNGISPKAALHHVEERAEHLAEPRPEYGHCTNAVCIVGRRAVTRDLFLDRRAFLTSYDATQDPDNEHLARVLGAVIPVCAGISLEYYFSFVDNEGYGCGTKLPHNVTGLVGVMNGYQSDLRTGLPWQMVEIHEPVRCLFVVETTPDRVLATIHKSSLLTEFLVNRWIRLATLDPIDGRIHAYRDGVFERIEGDDEILGAASSSMEWYSGTLAHLPLARIGNREVAA